MNGVDTGINQVFLLGKKDSTTSWNWTAAELETYGVFTTSFTVASNGDPVTIKYQSSSSTISIRTLTYGGGNSFGLNGFELDGVEAAAKGTVMSIK